MWLIRLSFILLAAVIVACTSNPPAQDADRLKPPATSEGFQLSIEAVAPAGEEIIKCLILDELPVEDGLIYVDRIEHKQSPYMHHMDLISLEQTGLTFEPGMHDCQDIYGDNVELMMETILVIYAGQEAGDAFDLPPGVAAPVPTQTQFMFEVHYVNTTDEDVSVFSDINAYFADTSQVTETIWGGAIRDRHINIPPKSTEHVEWSRCVMSHDIDLLVLSSHTHELARRLEVRQFNGENVQPELIYENNDWIVPYVQRYPEPLHIPAGEGFEFRCIYASNRDTMTHWGLTARDEMCQIAIVHTPGLASISCDVVETSDGVIHE